MQLRLHTSCARSAKIALFAAIILCGSLSVFNNIALATSQVCPGFADPVRVNIGESEFHIPADDDPHLFFVEKTKRPIQSCKCFDQGGGKARSGYCQEPGEVFQLEKFAFLSGHIKNAGANNAQLSQLQVTVFQSSDAYRSSCTLKLRGNSSEEQKLDNNISTYKQKYGGIIYHLNDQKFLGGDVITSCNAKDTGVWGKLCTAHFPLNNHILLEARFYDKKLPISQWAGAFKQLEDFIRTLAVQPLSDHSTSCN